LFGSMNTEHSFANK